MTRKFRRIVQRILEDRGIDTDADAVLVEMLHVHGERLNTMSTFRFIGECLKAEKGCRLCLEK